MAIHLPADPPVVDLAVQSVLWRVHPHKKNALWFGRAGKYRFDAPGDEYGVCYFGSSLGVTILETLVRGKRVPTIARTQLEGRDGSALSPTETLKVMQLEGAGLPSFGVSVHEVTGPDYTDCRDLSLRVWKEHPELDGIQYRSRWDNSLCWAVFDRAERKFVSLATQWLGDTAVVNPAIRPYKHVSVT
jgi:hypothetical protein